LGEPRLVAIPPRAVAPGGDLRRPEDRPQVLHPRPAGPPRRPPAPGLLGLVPRAPPGRVVVPLLADRHPSPDRAPLPGGTGASEAGARPGHPAEPPAAGR